MKTLEEEYFEMATANTKETRPMVCADECLALMRDFAKSRTITDSVTYEQITSKARELYGKDLQKRSVFIRGAAFARQPSFHEVEWREYRLMCGNKRVGYIEEEVDKANLWVAYDYKKKWIKGIFDTEAEAKSAVEQAWKEFLTQITK